MWLSSIYPDIFFHHRLKQICQVALYVKQDVPVLIFTFQMMNNVDYPILIIFEGKYIGYFFTWQFDKIFKSGSSPTPFRVGYRL